MTERKKNDSENKIEHRTDQSQQIGTFENENHVNKIEQNETTISGQSDISTLKSSQLSKDKEHAKIDRENSYHWGAIREIMDIIRSRNKSSETRRLVEQRNALSRNTGTPV